MLTMFVSDKVERFEFLSFLESSDCLNFNVLQEMKCVFAKSLKSKHESDIQLWEQLEYRNRYIISKKESGMFGVLGPP